MKKVATVNKALLLLTLLFVLIAAFSFTAFRSPKGICTDAKKCSEAAPPKRAGGQMLWDDFSHRVISLVSIR